MKKEYRRNSLLQFQLTAYKKTYENNKEFEHFLEEKNIKEMRNNKKIYENFLDKSNLKKEKASDQLMKKKEEACLIETKLTDFFNKMLKCKPNYY